MSVSQNIPTRKICVGQFIGAHGVRGLLKLRSFTAEPGAIFSYTPLMMEKDEDILQITLQSKAKEYFVVAIAGISDRDAADHLRGKKVYISHTLLPKTRKGEYYEADLIGLNALDAAGRAYGQVLAVFDYGAGVFLEIGTSKNDSFMLPFKDSFVPKINLEAGKILVDVPADWTKVEKGQKDAAKPR